MKELDEKRAGLLIRMSFHRICFCAKRFQEPLIRRGFVKPERKGYVITPAGEAEVKRLLKKYEGKHLETYRGISIGTECMLLSSSQ